MLILMEIDSSSLLAKWECLNYVLNIQLDNYIKPMCIHAATLKEKNERN